VGRIALPKKNDFRAKKALTPSDSLEYSERPGPKGIVLDGPAGIC
jgi:hypothetical protein